MLQQNWMLLQTKDHTKNIHEHPLVSLAHKLCSEERKVKKHLVAYSQSSSDHSLVCTSCACSFPFSAALMLVVSLSSSLTEV